MSAPQVPDTFDKRVVLTGAGFSRNWGGYLATEMWGVIMGHPAVESRDRLRSLLRQRVTRPLRSRPSTRSPGSMCCR